MRDTYYKWEPQKLESYHFSNTLVLNIVRVLASSANCLDSLLVSVLDSYFGASGSSHSHTDFYVDLILFFIDG